MGMDMAMMAAAAAPASMMMSSFLPGLGLGLLKGLFLTMVLDQTGAKQGRGYGRHGQYEPHGQ